MVERDFPPKAIPASHTSGQYRDRSLISQQNRSHASLRVTANSRCKSESPKYFEIVTRTLWELRRFSVTSYHGPQLVHPPTYSHTIWYTTLTAASRTISLQTQSSSPTQTQIPNHLRMHKCHTTSKKQMDGPSPLPITLKLHLTAHRSVYHVKRSQWKPTLIVCTILVSNRSLLLLSLKGWEALSEQIDMWRCQRNILAGPCRKSLICSHVICSLQGSPTLLLYEGKKGTLPYALLRQIEDQGKIRVSGKLQR